MPPCSRGSFWKLKSQCGERGGPRAVCGESANTDGEREAGCEEPALLPSPSAAASCSLPPAGATAAVGTWPWSLRKATGRGGAGAQGEAELGAGLGARGTPAKPQGPAVKGRGGAGRDGEGRIGRYGRGLCAGGGAIGKRRLDATAAAGRVGLRVPRKKGRSFG